ncbi:MAG: alpha/beta hydrolase [Dehalococcoidia bacterium]|nr:alpha/beta hydrolase [Dehalococcoidia bacterium]
MPDTKLADGTAIHFDLLGTGPTVALISGGRREGAWLQPTAEKLAAAGYEVLLHDRRNCGTSDVVIERRFDAARELSEQEIWADDLNELLTQLGRRPAWVGGTSAGCRVSLLLAIRHPEAVGGLLLWRVTGGEYAAKSLGRSYYEQFTEVAERDGMAGVINTPFFAERIRQNPANRDRLLAMDPKEFIAIMLFWRTYFRGDVPVVGVTEEELRGIRVATLIISGDDDTHPKEAADWLQARMPEAEFLPPTWSKAESDYLLQDETRYGIATAEKLPPILLPFLNKHRV